jgi:hypothetical protein
MYSFNNQYPIETMPKRIRLSSGETRTGTFSNEELADAGYTFVGPAPSVTLDNKVVWNSDSGSWEVFPKSVEDFNQENHIAWETVRNTRNALLSESDWTQVQDLLGRYPLHEKIQLKLSWAEYREQLRNIPQQYSTPQEVVWPTPPESINN